mgnify:CR=1 FL=1
MKLHEDKFAFLNIINLIHEASSIRADILEKDYYVTLLLRELAGKQVTLPAYFKGGTALYTVLFGFGCKFEHIQFNTSVFALKEQNHANFVPEMCQLFARLSGR